jgi:hypothetical protein
LARGEPVERIARQLHTSKHTVISLREQEWNDIARRKQLIIPNAARLAANGFDKLNAENGRQRYKGPIACPGDRNGNRQGDSPLWRRKSPLTNLNLNFQRGS